MVDLRTWSVKLRERAKRIVAQLSGVTLLEAEQALEATDWQVRQAIAWLQSKRAR
jgi:N-acetylmuramic acid 6-phosphate etherase